MRLTFHVEAVADPAQTARRLRQMGCRHVGITLNPATAVGEDLSGPGDVDHVLIMSVVPGFRGQKFMPEVLPKVETDQKTAARPISGWRSTAEFTSRRSARREMPAWTGSWWPARFLTRRTATAAIAACGNV